VKYYHVRESMVTEKTPMQFQLRNRKRCWLCTRALSHLSCHDTITCTITGTRFFLDLPQGGLELASCVHVYRFAKDIVCTR